MPQRRQFLASCLAGFGAATVARAGLTQSGGRQSGKEVPWLAQVQRQPDKLPSDSPRLSSLMVGDRGEQLLTLTAWRQRREQLRNWWINFLHPLELATDLAPALKTISEDRDDGAVRQLVRYDVEPGISTEAYLLKPIKLVQRTAGVVVFHSTVPHSIRQPAGIEGKPEKAFALKLAQKGYVAICPRNFLWPSNQEISAREETDRFSQRHPKCKGMAKMLFDARIATSILSSLPEVDSARIGAVGHSLGAKEVLYLAALDERIKVSVSSEGGIGTRFSNWDAPWYLGPTIKEPQFDHEHHELLGLVAPRPFLLVGGDSADGARSWPFIEEALRVYKLYGDTPRLGLFNHAQGHNVPPQAERRIYEWFDAYL